MHYKHGIHRNCYKISLCNMTSQQIRTKQIFLSQQFLINSNANEQMVSFAEVFCIHQGI